MNEVPHARVSNQYWPELDGIRGLAILMVLGFHYGWDFFHTTPGSFWAYLLVPLRLMWSGVDLFFVLSGFLIVGILLRTRNDPGYFRIFYGRRACRILPLYVVMGLLFLAGIWLHQTDRLYAPMLFEHVQGWTWSVLFLQNFMLAAQTPGQINFLGPTWSLAVEEQMYLALPLLIFALRIAHYRTLWLFVSMFMLAALFRYGLSIENAERQAVYIASLLPMTRMDAFAAGGLLAWAWQAGWLREGRMFGAAFFLFLAGLVGMAVLAWKNVFGVQLYLPIIAAYAGLIALALCAPAGFFLRSFLRLEVLRWFGKVSYGLYLMHIPVLGICLVWFGYPELELVGPKPQWITLTALAILLPLAQLSHRYFERPLLSWGRGRWVYQRG